MIDIKKLGANSTMNRLINPNLNEDYLGCYNINNK